MQRCSDEKLLVTIQYLLAFHLMHALGSVIKRHRGRRHAIVQVDSLRALINPSSKMVFISTAYGWPIGGKGNVETFDSAF
jgi:hypothetical protein